MTTDVQLNTDKGYYDIGFTADGDIAMSESLDNFILMTIFAEVRATADEIPENTKRRGWVGNETTPNFEQGSKAWLFEQERATGSTLAELGAVINNAMQVLVTEGLASSVTTDTPKLKNNKVTVTINIYRDGSPVDTRFFELWDNTGL